MTDQIRPYPVSDTAALVMLWASSYYREIPAIRRYVELLDLTPGIMLVELYNEICPWYSEVIINRKHFIKNAAFSLLETRDGPTIIVNLGAGLSPLSLELLPSLSEECHIIEIDLENAGVKQRLYHEIDPVSSDFIRCIPGDITDTSLLVSILSEGCADVSSTRFIIVMEGLTYYIPRKAMERVVATLSASFPHLAFVFEHLKPCHQINSDRRYIPYDIFSHVRDYTGCEVMTTYTEDGIIAMLGKDFTCTYSNMDQMEARRTGRRTYFPAPDDGWLSVAVAERR